jgi:hypothetical protein
MSHPVQVTTAAALGLCRGKGELVLAEGSAPTLSAEPIYRPSEAPPDLKAAHIRSVARERVVPASAKW